MTHEQFCNIFNNNLIDYYENFTETNFTEIEFSKNFNLKIKNLIAIQKKPYWNYINTLGKRIAIVIFAIFAVFASSMSVKAVRDTVLSYIKEVFEHYDSYTFSGHSEETISKQYRLSYIPKGFELTAFQNSEVQIYKEYSNPDGNLIIYAQYMGDGYNHTVDNEKAETKNIMIDNKNILLTNYDSFISAYWTDEIYVFEITCYGDFETEEIEKMIFSVKLIDNDDIIS